MSWKMSPQVFLVATYLVLLGALSVLLVSCGGGGGGSDGGSSVSALTVSQASPEANSTNIPVMTTASVDINEAVDAATITPGTLSVESSSGTVPGTVVCSGTTITFLPDVPLEQDTTYTATLSTNVEGLTGNQLTEDYSWEFTTVATSTGDPQNYIPFDQGRTWFFQGTITDSETGMTPVSYTNKLSVNGTKEIGGESTTVFIESNPDNSGMPIEGYLLKNLNGVTYYGDNDLSDTITPQITPYQEINFPATPGYSFTQIHKTGLDFGEDVDSDGINETFDVLSTVTIVSLETVNVPAGTFVDCAQVDTEILIDVRVSSDDSLYKFHGFESRWYAPDVGPVKMIREMTDPDGNTETITEVLTHTWTMTPITTESTVSGSLDVSDLSDSDGYYADLYTFTTPNTSDVFIRLDSSAFDTSILVFDGRAINDPDMDNWNAYLVDFADNSNTTTMDSQLSLLSLAAGSYVIVATSFNPSMTGPYTLTTAPALSGITAPWAYVQYRTFENPAEDHFRAFVDLRNNGQLIQATDIQRVELFDRNSIPFVPAVPLTFISSTYATGRWDTATSQFPWIGADRQSGFLFNLSNHPSITPGVWTFIVRPAMGLPFNFQTNFPGKLSLIPVASASMSSQWNIDGSLTLSWSEPIDNFEQYRIYFTDVNGNDILYARAFPGVTQVTLTASQVQEISLIGQLSSPTTVSWRMQTRNYDGENNYARSVSDPVIINWP